LLYLQRFLLTAFLDSVMPALEFLGRLGFESFSKQVSRLKQVGVRDKPVVREGEESGKRNCCSQDVLFG
jgi:hypothetical protein